MKRLAVVCLFLTLPLIAQNASEPASDVFKSLAFLQGTWEAKASGNGGIATAGTYSFGLELGGHIFARHSTSNAGCKGPATFDCEHGDLLYVYEDAPGRPLKAIYFDNEGHVIHYDVLTPDATTAVFVSSGPGPKFQLVYTLKAGIMVGKFQMQMPGQAEWKSYLEWSGAKK